ncbi:hypothetical protein X777_11988 [Ooceraea biroi]|uniref:GIY-YIG domain-containing protein n=1 Tax=Ooceraea biroi TaxID=2015173 RepID=A0A026WZV8_OOCBI|nr:hypothetical protein X777_11988 [Ooceraea biroi]
MYLLLQEKVCEIVNMSKELERLDFMIAKPLGMWLNLTMERLDCIIKSGKDALPDSNKTGVVYRLKCKDCDACYVGQTKRHLATRVKEHRSDISKREVSIHLRNAKL